MLDPRAWQVLFAVGQLSAVVKRLKHECSPSTLWVSSHRVHEESGHRDTQADDDMDPTGA
jgi:hypothetical protein